VQSIPIIVQLNKQDLSNALPPQLLVSSLNCQNNKTLLAVACKGQGVFDTLKAIINGVVTNIQKEVA
jgi:signal recognition particle receptor subunit beta